MLYWKLLNNFEKPNGPKYFHAYKNITQEWPWLSKRLWMDEPLDDVTLLASEWNIHGLKINHFVSILFSQTITIPEMYKETLDCNIKLELMWEIFEWFPSSKYGR